DQLSDKDGNQLTVDINGDGVEGDKTVPGEIISPATYDPRNARIDVLSFFARNLFSRQTGNPGTYVDNLSSQEAWIWYGHLWLPSNNAALPYQPGAGSAPP